MERWTIANKVLSSRLFLGTSRYPSLSSLESSIKQSGASVLTVSLRREKPSANCGDSFWSLIKSSGLSILPNTAGCRSVKEAVSTAHLARELFQTHWIKLEVIGDEYSLMPDPFGLVEAATRLVKDGFEVFPYMTADLIVGERLIGAGCRVLMPLAAPIGTGRGLVDKESLIAFRNHFPNNPLIMDAGIGKPSHAAAAMELGYDGILLNTAVATAQDPVKMAEAFSWAIQAGRRGYEAGLMAERNTAVPSTPVLGTPFWHLRSSET